MSHIKVFYLIKTNGICDTTSVSVEDCRKYSDIRGTIWGAPYEASNRPVGCHHRKVSSINYVVFNELSTSKIKCTRDNQCVCAVAVDGGWGQWRYEAPCDRAFGLGTAKRIRSCDNPSSKYNGSECWSISEQRHVMNEFSYIPCEMSTSFKIGLCVGAVVILMITIVIALLLVRRHRRYLRNETFIPAYMKANPDYDVDLSMDVLEQFDILGYDPIWEFPRSELELKIILGSGAFGEVWLAEATGMKVFKPRYDRELTLAFTRAADRNKWLGKKGVRSGAKHVDATTNLDKQLVAVKTLKENPSEHDLRELQTEIKVLIYAGQHPNIVNILGACTRGIDKPTYAILEYCCNGNLKCFLENNVDKFDYEAGWDTTGYSLENCITLYNLIQISTQICKGMEFLHSRKLIHRDLAARNILVTEDHIMKVADFGAARTMYAANDYVKESKTVAPIKWLSPESLITKTYTFKTDTWSFGVLMWEIFSFGETPYPGLTHKELVPFLQDGERMNKPDICPDGIYEIMCNCWEYEPKKRPLIKEIKKSLEKFVEDEVCPEEDIYDNDESDEHSDDEESSFIDNKTEDLVVETAPNENEADNVAQHAEKKRLNILERHKKLLDQLRARGVNREQIYDVLGISKRTEQGETSEPTRNGSEEGDLSNDINSCSVKIEK